MISLIKTLVKFSIVGAIFLLLGHLIEWKGSSLSEHAKGVSDVLKTEASSAREWVEDQGLPEKVEEKAEEFIERVNHGMSGKTPPGDSPLPRVRPEQKSAPKLESDMIEDSERAKLRSLIRDLNR